MKTPPLALYAHFPWCVQKCPYCDFNSYTLRETLPEERYIDTLLRDLDAQTIYDDMAAWIRDPAAPLPSGADKQPE